MKQKLLVNLLLLLLVTAMGTIVWLLPAPQKETLPTLTNEDPAAIREIIITRSNGQSSHFIRKGQNWWMTAPYALPANHQRLQMLARIAEAPVVSEFPLPKQGLEQFGLDRPILVRLNQLRFEFGSINPVSKHRYIRHGERLTLSVDRFYHHVDQPVEQLLALELLPPDSQLKEIVTPRYRLFRTERGWALDPPDPRFTSDQLVRMAQLWRDVQATQIIMADNTHLSDSVIFTLEDGSIKRFGILTRGETTWLVDPASRLSYQLPTLSPLLRPQPENSDAGTTGG